MDNLLILRYEDSMTFRKLVSNSLFHYKGINAMVLLGVALTSAILSGALVVGDSVKESLRRNAAARLSKVDSVLLGGERFFTQELARRIDESVAPILQVEGTVATRGGGKRSNRVQILGVDERFWKLSQSGRTPPNLTGDSWFVEIGAGETLICRVEIPGELSKDAPLSGESEQTQPFTGEISAILGADQLGRYSLQAEQVPKGTVYLPLKQLQTILEKPGMANLILAPAEVSDRFQKSVTDQWQLADASLHIKAPSNRVQSETQQGTVPDLTGYNQLTSPRIFIDPETAALAEQKADIADSVLTYLANKIRFGEKLTPYSMITGTSGNLPSPTPKDLKDNEIVLSQWLADDLGAKPGDTVTLDYYVVDTGRKLSEESAEFTVRSIEKIGEKDWDQSWTPEFPGIFEVENLNDWEPGIPIDRSLIRDKDEDFWDTYRATPKAFITLAASRKLFANRFGNTTAVRFETDSLDAYRQAVKAQLSLGDIGLSVRNVGEEARQAVGQSFDFGALFASMSFFLIVAALVLTALVFIFGIESRSNQIGLLLATGFPAAKARQLFLAEAACLSIVGAILGLFLGWIYTKLALSGMAGAWQEAAAGIDFVYHVKPATLAISFFGTVLLALATVWLASRAVTKVKPGRLIAGNSFENVSGSKPLFRSLSFIGLVLFLVSGTGCLLAPKVEGTMTEQGLFFGAGFCFVLAGVCACSLFFRRLEKPSSVLNSLSALGRQNTVRRKGRSLAVIGLMAAGVFMVTAINSFRLEGERGANRRDSGTGGFTHVGESTLPIYEDLNSEAGRKKYGLENFDSGSFTIIPFRVSDGEDASCLNLNRAQRPRLMGVDPALLSGTFKFTKQISPEDHRNWQTLAWQTTGIPAIVDMNTATYALQTGVGQSIEYENATNEAFQVTIAAFLETSILQGNLIIAEKHFIEQFPDSGGYRFFLLDCADPALAEKIATHLTRMFGDRGLAMRPAADRLNEFNAVQNTYLSIFSTLGGLGILLGTVGLAIVVGRNVMERKGQLGLMQAVGFTRESLAKLVLSEHWFLHITGVLIGIFAAIIAVFPKLVDRASDLPWGLLVGVNLAVLVGGLVFCWLAARLALKGKLIDALRSE
ncbi:MAG: FtsX-like permease family protein [Verrucomicrobiales bacterium]|nr:FtsX-like permease family protein [Verrucomicrobiales bacterium]